LRQKPATIGLVGLQGRKVIRALVPAALLAAALLVPVPTSAGTACTGHGRAYLAGFPADAGSPFYSAREGNDATATITVTPGDCGGEWAQASFATADATATASGDYIETSGHTDPLCRDSHPDFCVGALPEDHVLVPTETDGDEERAIESFWFRLIHGTRGLVDPSSAPIHIIDENGPPRFSLEPTVDGSGAVPYTRSESFARIRIPVFLAGTSESGSVAFTVEPAPGSPATPGEDFAVSTPSPLQIGSDRVGFIDIDIVNDKVGEGDESVAITLHPGTGYEVEEPSSTTLTILDNEENVFPVSRFHHPRERWKYNKADYRIREFHIFATDEGSGVVAAEMALRRNLKNGKCAWKMKKGWQKKDCQNRTWLPTKYDDTGELFYYRMKQLKPSVKTKIKNYTAFSRAIDGAGNVEKEFNKKRNANTFEIRRKGKTKKAKG
jgi:hypothetical protein